MKQNLYTESVKKIRAPKNIVNKAIRSIYGTASESEVIIMKKPNKTFIFVSAMAAVLAVVVAIGAVFSFKSATKKTTELKENMVTVSRSFALTANAGNSTSDDEINTEYFINVGEVKGYVSSQTMVHRKQHNENGEEVYDLKSGSIILLNGDYTFDLNCVGEDIESVTYTAYNCSLGYEPNYEGLISADKLIESGGRVRMGFITVGDQYNWASSCTFDYNRQPNSLNNFGEVTDIDTGETYSISYIPLRMSFDLEIEEGKYKGSIDETTGMVTIDGDEDVNEIFMKEFNACAEEISLQVTANFTDGTTDTKTLRFKCEADGSSLNLLAIEV